MFTPVPPRVWYVSKIVPQYLKEGREGGREGRRKEKKRKERKEKKRKEKKRKEKKRKEKKKRKKEQANAVLRFH